MPNDSNQTTKKTPMVEKITKAAFPGLKPGRLVSIDFADVAQAQNFIRETIKRAAKEIDIRGLVDDVCGAWNIETPIGFATDLQNKIVDHMIEKASEI